MRGSTLLLFFFLASGCLLVNCESLDISFEKTQEGETNVCFTFSNCDISESCQEPTTKCVKLDGDFFKNLWERILGTIGSRPDLIALIMNRFPFDIGMYDSLEPSDFFEYVDPGSNAMMKMAKSLVEEGSTMGDNSILGSTELPSTTGSYQTTTPNNNNPWSPSTRPHRYHYYRYNTPAVVYTPTFRTPYSRRYSRSWYTTSSPNVKDSTRRGNMFASVDEANGGETFVTSPYPIDDWKKRSKSKMGRRGGRWNDKKGPDYVPKDWRTERPKEAEPSTTGMYGYGKKGPWNLGMYRPGKDELDQFNPEIPWKTFKPPPMGEEDNFSDVRQPMMDGPWSESKYKPWMMNKPGKGGPPMGGMDESEVGEPWMMDGMDRQWMGPNGAPWMMKNPGVYGPPMGEMDGSGKEGPPMIGGMYGSGSEKPPRMGGMYGFGSDKPPMMGGMYGFGSDIPPMMGGMYGFGSDKPPMMGGMYGFGSKKPPMMGGMYGFGWDKPPMMGGMGGFGSDKPPMMGGMGGFGKRRPPMMGGVDESQDEGPPMMGISSMAPTLSTVTDGIDDLATEEGITEI